MLLSWQYSALHTLHTEELSASPTPSRVDLQQEVGARSLAFFPRGACSLCSISKGDVAAAIELHNKWFWLGASVNVCTHRTVFWVKERAQGRTWSTNPHLGRIAGKLSKAALQFVQHKSVRKRAGPSLHFSSTSKKGSEKGSARRTVENFLYLSVASGCKNLITHFLKRLPARAERKWRLLWHQSAE